MTLAHVLMSILLCLVFGLAASRSWLGVTITVCCSGIALAALLVALSI